MAEAMTIAELKLSEETLAKVAALKRGPRPRNAGKENRWDELAVIAEVFGGEIAAGMERGDYRGGDYMQALAAASRAKALRQLETIHALQVAILSTYGDSKARNKTDRYIENLESEAGI